MSFSLSENRRVILSKTFYLAFKNKRTLPNLKKKRGERIQRINEIKSKTNIQNEKKSIK